MKKKLVIFGVGDYASLAWYVLTHDSDYEVVAFAVDAAFLQAPAHQGLPVVAFERLAHTHPPDQFELLITLGPRQLNGLRARRYQSAKAAGYRFATWVSSRAITWGDLHVGENCMVYEGAIVKPFARIGHNSVLISGCNVSHHVVVEDHVFVAAGAMVAGGARLCERVFLGLGSMVCDGVVVAPRCMVGAGAVVTANTEPDGLYIGVPAKRRPLPNGIATQ